MTYGHLLAALSTAFTTLTAPAAPADPFFSYDRPATYEVRTERVQVPLRDGGHLACDLHRPAAEGRFPVIVYDYTAYDQLETLGRAAAWFVARGYSAAVCNARGSGDSPGHLDPFSAQEQRDNYDLIEWLAAQPWSTGRVGQTGVSYGGHSSLLVAVNKPPHLAAIIPVDGISDWYENTIYRGGIYSARIRDWQRATAPDTLTTYAQHPLYDDFWRERSVKARWKDLDVPVLEIAGWYDRYRQAMVDNFRARPRNVWLVAGPWQHGWPAGQPADIGNGPYLAWWDRWLGGRRDAPLPAAKVTSYEAGAGGGWKSWSTWPPPGARRERLGLGGDGTLTARPGAPVVRRFAVNTGEAPATPDERLTFQTQPYGSDLVLTGEITAEVRAAFTATDGNIAVVAEDVRPDGTATRITQGWLKASHRFGHTRAVPVRPGKTYDLTIRTWPTHYRLAAGHSLRVTVSSDDYPEIDSDAPAGHVDLRLGRGGTGITLTTWTEPR
ncbi:CocE/NonD family hydrolase [Nonomuraea sp. FMUSA5-5]|uniref:CocE/NonD family hydrolase n=1 Tax=Nonomuraea composti TaxID=2720023 RepID=A0ABX1BBH8_9ACTN|nr:CocE/NonD family hydrolase [Nonomuraea sp. FMUSA5-5]NJP93877.1 CocE/NonD family hydrolase [Nonomuraea sp. FMUSA5-5]